MAVGKASMARASKAASGKAEAVEVTLEKKAEEAKAPAQEEQKKPARGRKPAVQTAQKKSTRGRKPSEKKAAAPKQTRTAAAAKPQNRGVKIGEEMPVYYY